MENMTERIAAIPALPATCGNAAGVCGYRCGYYPAAKPLAAGIAGIAGITPRSSDHVRRHGEPDDRPPARRPH